MKKLVIYLFSAALLASTSVASAASISWQAATDITGDSDVLTGGTLAYAFDFGITETDPRTVTTVNGVDFVQEQINIASGSSTSGLTQFTEPGGGPWLNGAAGGNLQTLNWDRTPLEVFGSSAVSTPFTNASAPLQELLKDAMRNNESPTARALRAGYTSSYDVGFNLRGLTVGQDYAVQLFVNDSRGTGTNRSVVFSDGTNNVTVDANSGAGGTEGNLGQFVIGNFTADSTDQQISLVNGVSVVVSALQVRAVPEPASGLVLLFGCSLLNLMRRKR